MSGFKDDVSVRILCYLMLSKSNYVLFFCECELIKYYISCTEKAAHRFIEMCIYNKWWEIRELCLTLLCNPFVADLPETSLMCFPSHILSPLSPHKKYHSEQVTYSCISSCNPFFFKMAQWVKYFQIFPEQLSWRHNKKRSDQTKPYMLCCIIWLKMQCVDLAKFWFKTL